MKSKRNILKQKFFHGQRVRLTGSFPKCMDHFDGRNHEAIIDHSYADAFGGPNHEDFAIIVLPNEGDNWKPYWTAWYPRELMTLVSDDRIAGEEIIQRHNESRE